MWHIISIQLDTEALYKFIKKLNLFLREIYLERGPPLKTSGK